jgi:apolipoprotein N-acyltransferase
MLMRSAPGVGVAVVRGWWFGVGYLFAAHYWTLPNIGPGLVLVAPERNGMYSPKGTSRVFT